MNEKKTETVAEEIKPPLKIVEDGLKEYKVFTRTYTEAELSKIKNSDERIKKMRMSPGPVTIRAKSIAEVKAKFSDKNVAQIYEIR
jgi:hypothetical protein